MFSDPDIWREMNGQCHNIHQIIGCSIWLQCKSITNTQWIYHSGLFEAPMVMETHRFAFITMGCRYTVIHVTSSANNSPHKSTTELIFHFQIKSEIKTPIPLPKRNCPTPIQQYKHCIFKWLPSTRHALVKYWSAGRLGLYIYSVTPSSLKPASI